MKKRIDLITSKECWREFISRSLWLHTNNLSRDYCDKVAKKMADKYFMGLIKEIKKYKPK